MKVYTPSNSSDLERAILWQYENADRLNALIQNQQAFYDENVTAFWDDYRDSIFDLDTADAFGLTVWGAILGVERPSYLVLGVPTTFSDDQYRALLKARIMLTDMTGSMKDINGYIAYLFPDKPISVYDNLDMTVSYYFDFTPTAEESALIAIDGVLPRPAGVESISLITAVSETFGFAGQQLGQLDNSVFVDDDLIDDRVLWETGVLVNTSEDYVYWE